MEQIFREQIETAIKKVGKGQGIAFKMKDDIGYGSAIPASRITSVGDDAFVIGGKKVVKYSDLSGVMLAQLDAF